MLKRLCILLLTLLLILPCALADTANMPEWTYPIDALTLRDANGYLVLANRESLLPSSYAPDDLVNITMRHVSGGFQLRKSVNEALQKMFEAALNDGHTLYVKSAYRSYQTQNTMYYNRLEKYGRDDGLVAFPGASDHQTGLGVDVLNYDWANRDGMNAGFASTQEGQWMAAHCHEYGFVIRYMSGKEAVTGIDYEPWHLRYVGDACAAYMMQNTLSLEEFTLEWQGYIADFEAGGGDFQAYCNLLCALPPAVYTGAYDASGDEEVSLFYGD